MIEQDLSYRPRVPRETRRLLIAVLAAVVAMWALARVRFPEQPAATNPVTPLLSQLTTSMRFSDLASQLAAVRPRIEAVIQPFSTTGASALRVRRGVGLMMPADEAASGLTVLARDGASGLTVVAIAETAPSSAPALWSPDRLDQPRYLVAAVPGRGRLHLVPFLTNALEPVSSSLWPGRIWAAGYDAHVPPGSFVFTEDGQLVGMTSQSDDVLAIVPAATLVVEVDRLLASGIRTPGWLGVDTAALTPSLARAVGAVEGVLVSWVDPRGPSPGALFIGDVIDGVDGATVRSIHEWHAHADRLAVGQTVTLRIRRKGTIREVALAAVAQPAEVRRLALGLVLQRAREGSEIVRVEAGSVAEAAGLRAGDVVVHAGDVTAPTPLELQQQFASTRDGQPLLIAITRDGAHHALTLEKDAP